MYALLPAGAHTCLACPLHATHLSVREAVKAMRCRTETKQTRRPRQQKIHKKQAEPNGSPPEQSKRIQTEPISSRTENRPERHITVGLLVGERLADSRLISLGVLTFPNVRAIKRYTGFLFGAIGEGQRAETQRSEVGPASLVGNPRQPTTSYRRSS